MKPDPGRTAAVRISVVVAAQSPFQEAPILSRLEPQDGNHYNSQSIKDQVVQVFHGFQERALQNRTAASKAITLCSNDSRWGGLIRGITRKFVASSTCSSSLHAVHSLEGTAQMRNQIMNPFLFVCAGIPDSFMIMGEDVRMKVTIGHASAGRSGFPS
jgi:hypothetical protein